MMKFSYLEAPRRFSGTKTRLALDIINTLVGVAIIFVASLLVFSDPAVALVSYSVGGLLIGGTMGYRLFKNIPSKPYLPK